jgi:succinate-semialdehyde dehydrogenase/glutarate-semialdehyde dehydrogenase
MLAKMITVEMGNLLAHADGERILSTEIFDHYASSAESFLADKIL